MEQTAANRRPRGMVGFIIVAIGQFISLVGTNMTGFGLTIWAYEVTGSATALALVGFFFMMPLLVVSPIAGALVDRSNRKVMMMLSDLASGLVTILILILYLNGLLEIWHLYISAFIQGTFQSFQWPAYSAAITTMVPREQYGRANGLLSLAESGSGIFSPLLAAALLGIIGLGGILTIDIITFIFAIGSLLLVHIPQPVATAEGKESRGSIWKESVFGFWYIIKRRSLLGLQLIFLVGNFFVSIPFAVLAAMILARTNMNEIILGSVGTAGAIGGVVGGLVMSAWGGPKRKIHGVLAGWILSGLASVVLYGFGKGLVVWAIAGFIGAFIIPILNGSNQAIWQSKVAPDIQGRVFSIRRLIAWFVTPLATLIAGPLSDFVLEPAMQSGGSLSTVFEPLVGTGPGAGMALLFIFCGLAASIVGLSGYFIPAIRNVETIMPDYDLETGAEISPTAPLETEPVA